MGVTYGNDFQPSLRDLVYTGTDPNAEALGYCRPVPPGRSPRHVPNRIQPRPDNPMSSGSCHKAAALLSLPCSVLCVGRNLLEQLRREFVEVIAPVDPGMGARSLIEYGIEIVLLQHGHRAARGFNQEIVLARREPE